MSALRGEWRMLALIGFVAFAAALVYPLFSLNHDTSWYLTSTRMFMDGAQLYRDIIEINPPLSFYLTVPSLLFADITQIGPTTSFFVYTSTLCGISSAWAYLIALRAGLARLEAVTVLLCSLVALLILTVQDFGQREHLMLLFSLPYFTYLFFRERLDSVSRVELAACGLVAFFGLGLKPYFLLIPGGIVLARASRSLDWREFLNLPNFSLALALVGYLALIVVFHPLYIEQIVPTAALIYSAFGAAPIQVIFRPELSATAALIWLVVLTREYLETTGLAILGGLAGALASYLIQFKGWNYHIIPASFFIIFGVAWVVARNFVQLKKSMIFHILAASAVFFSLGVQVLKGPYASATTAAFSPFVVGRGTPVLVLSTNVSAAFPFVNEVGAQWTSRYPAQWLIPGAVRSLGSKECEVQSPQCDDYRNVLSRVRTTILDDIVENRPQIIFIDNRVRKSYFGNEPFEYIPFLSVDPQFGGIWKEYEYVGAAAGYQVWSLSSTTERVYK